jgi:hypothetical protein
VQTNATFSTTVRPTHSIQTRTGSATEVQRQKSPTTPPRQAIHDDLVRRDTIAPKTEPGSPSRQRQPAVAPRDRNPKRVRELKGEYEEPITTAASQEDIGISTENDYGPIFGVQVGRDAFVLTSEPAHTVDYAPAQTSTVEGHRRKKTKPEKQNIPEHQQEPGVKNRYYD